MHGYVKKEYEINEVPLDSRRLLKAEENIINVADRIICVSENFCNLMKKELKAKKDKITFVNSGIDLLTEKDNINIQRDDNFFTIVSIGGGIRIKNNIKVCKAIDKLKNVKIRYIVIGPRAKDGEKIIKYEFVQYYESLPHDKVLQILSQSNLYIQNSYFESFGLGIVEAIECRL